MRSETPSCADSSLRENRQRTVSSLKIPQRFVELTLLIENLDQKRRLAAGHRMGGAGEASLADLELLENLAGTVKSTSLCGLGQTAPNPVLSTLMHFREEYIEHIVEKKCRAHKCPALVEFFITDACTGCTLCERKCPVTAISGEKKERHSIDQALCIKCGTCLAVCKFGAVIKQ